MRWATNHGHLGPEMETRCRFAQRRNALSSQRTSQRLSAPLSAVTGGKAVPCAVVHNSIQRCSLIGPNPNTAEKSVPHTGGEIRQNRDNGGFLAAASRGRAQQANDAFFRPKASAKLSFFPLPLRYSKISGCEGPLSAPTFFFARQTTASSQH